jgi:ABC-2 type transport system ATP-binding protein
MEVESAPAIRITGARKRYKPMVGAPERDAVRGVDIAVTAGTIHGLLGPNGAGKTTTIKMLLGLVKPTAGEFRILDEDSTRPHGRRRVGFMPEQPYFPQHLRAEQALRLYAQLAGVPREDIAGRTSRLMERVGLQGREKTTLDAFSRGMLQRLGIAQALINDPAVVVLDEPASGLDPVVAWRRRDDPPVIASALRSGGGLRRGHHHERRCRCGRRAARCASERGRADIDTRAWP